ncbi:MAG: hypothetical protein R3E02_09970 [Blastomonas sp.]
MRPIKFIGEGLDRIARLYALHAEQNGHGRYREALDFAICLGALLVSIAAAAVAILIEGGQP